MKIKNDFIKIKIGEKEYEFRNLIFNEYLQRIATRQTKLGNSWTVTKDDIELNYLSLKLDEPFNNVTPDKKINVNNMDISYFDVVDIRLKTSEKSIQIQYTYKLGYDFATYYGRVDKQNNTLISFNGLSEYKGRKIAGIGFQTWFVALSDLDLNLMAYLDVSEQNIYIQENQDIIITRQDTFSTDAKFYSNDKEISYPLHLAPISNIDIYKPVFVDTQDNSYTYQVDKATATLYSVGFSNRIDKIEKEFIMGKDFTPVIEGNKLKIKDIENKYFKRLLQPSQNIFPLINLYPSQENFKYIIYKYKLYESRLTGEYEFDEELQENVLVEKFAENGLFYHQAKEIELPINKNVDLVISYDRI